MDNSELIQLLKTRDVTRTKAYNLVVADLWHTGVLTKAPFQEQPGESRMITAGDLHNPVSQAIVRYFQYQIQEILLEVIDQLRHPPEPDVAAIERALVKVQELSEGERIKAVALLVEAMGSQANESLRIGYLMGRLCRT